ncbi:MAG: hypothetical protein LBU13_07955 [Synergistaceae bacterium]|nr:hypothetical protein [Synergistaceae bacterium]
MFRGKKNLVRLAAFFVLALFVSETAFPVVGAVVAEAAWNDLDGTAPRKEMEVVLEDEQLLDASRETMRMANVLVMVEATAGMEFSSTSTMPTVILAGGSQDSKKWTISKNDGADWPATRQIYNRTPEDIINMMAGATFGIGAMPAAWSGVDLEPGRNLYGRDLDASNNYPNSGKPTNPGDPEEFMKLYKGDYYFPFKDTAGDIPTAYKGQKKKLEIGYTKYGNGLTNDSPSHYNLRSYEVGTRVLADYTYNNLSGAKKFPYALVFKNPKYWENGWNESFSPKPDDLVPNDSRLYQVKLVLWNLMENKDMWGNIRFGLASTFLPHTNDNTSVNGGSSSPYSHIGIKDRYDFSGLYKVAPFGANAWTLSTFKSGPGDNGKPYTLDKVNKVPANERETQGRWNFRNGILIQSISGNVRGHNALHAQMYPMSQHMTNEIVYSRITDSDYGRDTAIKMRAMYKASHRASLLVPMRGYDENWTMSGRPSITQAERFKLWIDGFADLYNGTAGTSPAPVSNGNRSKQWHYYKNPEIGVAGVFVLPHAIYPDPRSSYGMSRKDYKDNVYTIGRSAAGEKDATAVWYSNKKVNTDYKYERFPGSTELEDPEAGARVHFNSGSGEAVGSILDFFSPPAGKYADLIPEQYPIRSACENNWVILITTGQEVKPEDNTSYQYTAAQAIKNLYDATNKATAGAPRSTTSGHLDGSKIYAPYEKVSMLVREANGEAKGAPVEIDLDNPIQTLVIGMIPDPSTITDAAVRTEIEDMKLNLTKMAVAGRGGNPDSITKNNMREAATQPYLAYDTDTLMQAVRAAMSAINDSSILQPARGVVAQAKAIDGLGDSSEIFMYKYRILRSNQWEVELERYIVKTNDEGVLVMRYAWEMGELIKPADRKLAYWKNGSRILSPLAQGDSDFKIMTGLDEDSIIPPSGFNFDKLSPSDALIKWLRGYDVSYMNMDNAGNPTTYARSHLLTDFGQDGITVVQNPTKDADFLPGYRQWAENFPKQDNILYGQTNDGILHAVNQNTGREELAILPPPSLVPGRLAVLTTSPSEWDGKRQWINILGAEAMGGQRSFPAYILDGAVLKRDFDLNQKGDETGWGSYLLSALGRGGSGLYMLDVTDHDAPKFMWYKEKIGDQLVRSDSASKIIDAAIPGGNDPDSAFMKLGFNSPKPVMGVTLKRENANPERAAFQNFIAMAGGAQHDADLMKNGKEGAVFLILDPKDGSVIASFDSASVGKNGAAWRNGDGEEGRRPYMGMMVSEPTLVKSRASVNERRFLTGRVLTADNRGNIFVVDMEDDDGGPLAPNLWKMRTIAGLSPSNGGMTDSRSIPHGLASGGGRGYTWAAGGTADIQIPKSAAEPYEEGFLRNAEQLIFSFKLLKEKDQGSFFSREKNDFKRLDADNPDSVYNPGDLDLSGDGAYSGWYVPLRNGTARSFDEYVSAKPVIINGTLYVATFIRKDKTPVTDSSVCATSRLIDGNSRLFAVDAATGAGSVWAPANGKTPKFIEFEGVKIMSLTNMKDGGRDKLFINLDILDTYNNNLRKLKESQPKLKNVLNEDDGSPLPGAATVDGPLGGSGFTLKPNLNVMQYWIKH